jgi:hypothetical protein
MYKRSKKGGIQLNFQKNWNKEVYCKIYLQKENFDVKTLQSCGSHGTRGCNFFKVDL